MKKSRTPRTRKPKMDRPLDVYNAKATAKKPSTPAPTLPPAIPVEQMSEEQFFDLASAPTSTPKKTGVKTANRERVAIWLDNAQIQQLRAHAKSEGVPINVQVRKAVEAYLAAKAGK